MIPQLLVANWRVIGLAAAAALVCGACTYGGFTLGRASGDKEVRRLLEASMAETKRMYDAGQAAVQKRNLEVGSLRQQSREDAQRIADLSRGVRVQCVTTTAADRLPGGADAGAPGAGRAAGEDLTGLLRQCLRTFGEVNRATTRGSQP